MYGLQIFLEVSRHYVICQNLPTFQLTLGHFC